MLLIAEIILTIIAWQKGWRWLALIPIGIAVVIGLIVGASTGSTDVGAYIIFDILAVIALIIMIVVKPKTAT